MDETHTEIAAAGSKSLTYYFPTKQAHLDALFAHAFAERRAGSVWRSWTSEQGR